MVIPDIIAFTIRGITDIIAMMIYLIYLLLRSGGGVEAAASISPLTFFFVDTCPHE